jgi:hypothetical protein
MSLYLRFHNLRQSFRALFAGDTKTGRLAIVDLAEFCRSDVSCVVVGKDGRVDTHATAVAEGRREVFLRIQQMLNLTDAQLLRLRTDEEIDDA